MKCVCSFSVVDSDDESIGKSENSNQGMPTMPGMPPMPGMMPGMPPMPGMMPGMPGMPYGPPMHGGPMGPMGPLPMGNWFSFNGYIFFSLFNYA